MERDELEKLIAEDLDDLRATLSTKTVEEIEAIKLEQKREIEILRAKMRVAEAERARKINRENLARELKVPVDHLSDEDVTRFLEIKRSAPRPGDVTVVPGVVVLTAKGQGGDDDA